jgi:hypothetical protein
MGLWVPVQVTLQAFYLPFALLGLSLLLGGNWVADLLGILAGHLCAILLPNSALSFSGTPVMHL